MANLTTTRSTAFYRKLGYKVANVEKDFRFPDHKKPGKWKIFKKDLFGAWDLLAVKGDTPGVIGIQPTTKQNAMARVKKILESEAILEWLLAGNKGFVNGWYKEGRFWKVQITEIKMEDIK